MEARVKISKAAFKNVEKYIKKRVTEITESVSLKIYNGIILGEYPYWSGSFISSWRLSIGSPDTSYNAPGNIGQYSVPGVKYDLKVRFGQTVFISNNAPHAYQVEFMGTPRHKGEGWYVAHHAVNNTVLTYKFT